MSEKVRLAELEPLIREVIGAGGEFTLRTHGVSMLPILSDGKDSVVLTSLPQKIRKGDVILYKKENGQYVLHRVVGVRADGYVTRGDNQTVNEYGVKHESVIAIVKDSKRIAVTDKKHRVYVHTLGIRCFAKRFRAFLSKVKNKLV